MAFCNALLLTQGKDRALVFISAVIKVGDRAVATANGVWKILGES